MSVTNVGALPHPATPSPLLGQLGDRPAGKPDALTSNSSNATANATTGGTERVGNRDVDANPLPPAQAATTPGTGQKVNIIA